MNELIYTVEDVSFAYPGCEPVLKNISFEVSAGESVAVLGANASGKSTLLHLLDGLYFASSGRISAFGTLLTERSVERPPFSAEFRSRVGFLFQNSESQLFCSRVDEELEFGPLQLGLEAEEAEHRAEEVAQMFGIGHLMHRSPQSLSGGEAKRVALASIITCAPSILLLDEPSAGLDPRTRKWLSDFLKAIRAAGTTLIMCSHDLEFVSDISHRALILSEEHTLVYNSPLPTALADIDMLKSVNLVGP